jgi:hypothetical protein
MISDLGIYIAALFGAGRYLPVGFCLTNDQLLIMLYSISEFITFVSYFVLGLSLINTYKWGVALSPSVKLLFGMFIFLCAMQHLTSLLTLYIGVYIIDLLMKVATAMVAAVTAVTTFRDFIEGPNSAGT